MQSQQDERIHVLARLLLVSPLLISLAVFTAAIDWWGEYWSEPMLFSSVASMVAAMIAMYTQRKSAGVFAVLVLLGIGAIISGGSILTGGMVAASIGWAGAAMTISLSKNGTLTRTSVATAEPLPWDALMEALQLSESAKRVLFRERELDLLRRTIQDDLATGDVHAALMLCDQMGSEFGAVEESEKLRSQIQEALHKQHETRIQDELKLLDALLTEHKWVEAYQFTAKMRRLYPETPLLHGVEQHIADTRVQYRHALEARFVDAAEKNNVEIAMELLKELDRYLTPDEARRFMETADSVITKYRDTLGTRFKLAVSDRRWTEAIGFGDAIIAQFPNTTMAREVRELLDTMQNRVVEDETVE
tara:strand:- start:408 stop:1493 length:1086 start_codon:yes stop_codon:yes gene_type:complete